MTAQWIALALGAAAAFGRAVPLMTAQWIALALGAAAAFGRAVPLMTDVEFFLRAALLIFAIVAMVLTATKLQKGH